MSLPVVTGVSALTSESAPMLLAVVVAVFTWWFATGLVLLLDGLPRRTYRWSLGLLSVLALGAFAVMRPIASVADAWASYAAFGCAILIWGWQELAFLTGRITGPRRIASTPGAGRAQLFREAVGAILWHELAIAAGGLLIFALVQDQPNRVALWSYGVLWAMRTSAKLNLHFGVRNPGLELLPPHLAYLSGYFRTRPFNAFLPLVITVSGLVLARMVDAARDPSLSAGESTGLALISALLALAILEHLMLVMPWSPAAPWRWALRGARAAQPPAP